MKWILMSATALSLQTHAMSKSTESPPATSQAYDADLFKKNDQIYSGHVEFLYWTVAEGALDYALKMQHSSWGGDSFAQGQFETGGYGYGDPGVRVGMHYFRAPHYWEIIWQYTRITNRNDDVSYRPNAASEFLTGTWPQIFTLPVEKAKSHLHLNYNVFDWLVDRVFIPNNHLRLRLLGGGIIGWMDQEWKIRYSDALANSTTIQNRWHFVGAGLKTGTMVDWYWTGELYMTALATFGALMGSYSNEAKQQTTFQPEGTNPAIPVRDAKYQDVRPVCTGQMLFGPSWQRNTKNNRFELFAGFEMNVWWNLQEVYRSTSSSSAFAAKETWLSSGLLALYGLTTRLTVDF